jgi:hypothetical protein
LRQFESKRFPSTTKRRSDPQLADGFGGDVVENVATEIVDNRRYFNSSFLFRLNRGSVSFDCQLREKQKLV